MPRTSEQLAELREDRRRQILDAALRVFARKGFEKAQVTDIAREAGLGRGTVYWYFDTKEAILRALVEAELEFFLDLSREIAEAGGSAAGLVNAIRRTFTTFSERPEAFRFLMRVFIEESSAEAARLSTAEVYEIVRKDLVGMLKKSRKAGLIPPVGDLRALASLLIAVGDGLLFQHLADPDAVSLEELERLLLEMGGFMAGAFPKKGVK